MVLKVPCLYTGSKKTSKATKGRKGFSELLGRNNTSIFLSLRKYFFAIQYYGECWGASVDTAYDRHGPSENCWSGVGGAYTNFVYRHTGDADIGDV